MLHPQDRGRVLAEHDRAHESNGTFSAEYRLLSKDGRTVWVRDEAVPAGVSGAVKILSCGGYPLLDSDGGYVGSVQTVADVTERRRKEWELVESERVFRLTFQAAAVGIAHVTPDGRWLRVNDELCRISGYSRTELERTDYSNLVPPDEDHTRREERVRSIKSRPNHGIKSVSEYCVRR